MDFGSNAVFCLNCDMNDSGQFCKRVFTPTCTVGVISQLHILCKRKVEKTAKSCFGRPLNGINYAIGTKAV